MANTYTNKRSGEAVAALHRKAGKMAHRLAPRGGARNDSRDILTEYADDIEDANREDDALFYPAYGSAEYGGES